MPCKTGKDLNGTFYIVPSILKDDPPEVAVWWNKQKRIRNNRLVTDERLILKQINGEKADVVELTLGQLYDAIDALNRAVENT